MKIGIIYCCYGNPEYVDDCLAPWLEAKKTHNILIAATHGQFKEYHDLGIEDNDIETIDKLWSLEKRNSIDYLYIQNNPFSIGRGGELQKFQSESEIRDKGLQWLLKHKCDLIWLLDNDERYTVEQINKIIEYINKWDNRFECWFSIPMKNYIFSGKEWISGFCPPRIFRKHINSYMQGYTLHKCYWDNDFEYIADTGIIKSYKDFTSKSIPSNLIGGGIKHLTWLYTNGKLKYEYQMKHFGHCGYKWNYKTNKLEFDIDGYYKKFNIPIPEINYE